MDSPTLLTHPILQPLWLLFLVAVLERVWAWPDKYHPLTLIRLLAASMARRVHPVRERFERSAGQQKISGGLAILVLLTPILVLMAILINLAEYPIFFEGFLLLIALHYQPTVARFNQVFSSLQAEKKILAREILSPLVLRETTQLSPLGMAKAAIESLLLRFTHQYCGVMVWFLIAGGVGALGYRLIFELSQCWNRKEAQYQHFGKPAAAIFTVLAYIPAHIIAACFALAENVGGAVSGFRQRGKGRRLPTTLLSVYGGALGVQLSGPVVYAGVKYRFAKVGGERLLRLADMRRALSATYKTLAVLLTFVALCSVGMFAILVNA